MVRVGLGLYKYSIAYGWKHSVTNGMSVSILVMLLTHYQKQQLILQINSNLLLLHAESTDEISACKPVTNIPDGFDTHRDVRYTCTHDHGLKPSRVKSG